MPFGRLAFACAGTPPVLLALACARTPPVLLALACALALPALLGFGTPPGIALAGAIAVCALGRWRGPGTALLLAGSLVASLAAYAGVAHWSGLDEAIYYRPHERYAVWSARHGHRAYLPRVDVRMAMPHGDIQAFTRERIAEPRDVVFRTDDDGFRNDHAYREGAIVLLGDSFVAGSGTTQERLLQAQLARHGVSAYNLGFPGGIVDYERFHRAFVARHGPADVVLFLFEGNDFPERTGSASAPAWWDVIEGRVRDATALFRTWPTSRLTRALAARAGQAAAIREGVYVDVHALGGVPVAFYTDYRERTRRASLPDMDRFDAAFARLAPSLHAVFFVPTKYRVYQPWIAPDESLPAASWQHLAARCAEYGLDCFDLTPALRNRSEELLSSGRFTWWRDDTHWNGEGIAAAAERVAEALGELRREGARDAGGGRA